MSNLRMFCLTMRPEHENLIKKLNYSPVGLGDQKFTNSFFNDKTGLNISNKNPFYGEYTFHYSLWKDQIEINIDEWIGFCQYRKFWTLKNNKNHKINFKQFEELIIKEIPKEFQSYDVILGEPLFVNQFRLSKFIKNNLFNMLKNPTLFINAKKRNLRFHFDMMHGQGNLSGAINLLDESEKEDFDLFLENSISFNPHNMFICKSKKILNRYYESLFPWLEKCESIFGFDLHGYGKKRIYGFLAERYMSYWFQKYTKFKVMPILFKDISDFKI